MKVDKVIIPVAGLGTRLLPATKAIPKEMLPIFSKPIIQYILEEISHSGFKEVIFVTHSSKYSIENHFDKSFELEATLEKRVKRSKLREIKAISKLDLNISSIRQGEALGLGHAVLTAKKLIGNEPFSVVLPDMILSDSLKKNKIHAFKKMKNSFELNSCSSILLAQAPKNKISSYGIAKLKKIIKSNDFKYGEIEKIFEKPSLKKAPSKLFAVGRYIFKNDFFKYLELIKPDVNQEIQLTDAIHKYILSENKVLGYIHEDMYFDCGEWGDYLKANLAFSFSDKEIKKDILKFLKDFNVSKK